MADGEISKDFLTGCYTRAGLYPQVQQLQSDYHRYRAPFSVLIIDIDHFKPHNDKYGHATGDEILKYFVHSIRASLVAEPTFLFRLGGDEFVVLFPAKASDEVKRLADRMNENLKRMPYQMSDRPVKLSFSAGISSYPMNGDTAEELLHRADQAMYFSKQAGRGRVTQYGNFFFVRLKRPARVFILLALAFFSGFEIGLVVQSRFDFARKILGAARETESFVAYLKEEASHTMKSVRPLFEIAPVVNSPNVSSLLDNIQKSSAASSGAPPTTAPPVIAPPESAPPARAWDLVYLKSGGILQGVILKEDEVRLTLQLNISANRGVLVLEKADVLKIVRKSAPEGSKL